MAGVYIQTSNGDFIAADSVEKFCIRHGAIDKKYELWADDCKIASCGSVEIAEQAMYALFKKMGAGVITRDHIL